MPTGHGTQLVALAWLEKEPALQTAGVTLPAVHSLPGGQSRQTEADVPPSSGEYRPGGHWVGELAPFSQKEPAVHSLHVSPLLNLPSLQSTQAPGLLPAQPMCFCPAGQW